MATALELTREGWSPFIEALSRRQVDFIDVETTGESLKRAIERYGVEL